MKRCRLSKACFWGIITLLLLGGIELFFAYRHHHKQNRARAHVHLVQGYEYMQAKEYDKALEQLRQAVALDSQNLNARILLGDLLCEQEQYTRAHTHYAQANKIKPHTTSILYRLARVEKKLKQWKPARAHAQEILTQTPRDAQAHYFLGNLCYAQRDLPAAINAYQQAITCDASCISACRALGYVYLDSGKLPEAWALFRATDTTYKATTAQPWWDGADPTGKTILIQDAGGFDCNPSIGKGFGDCFMALRYAKELKKKNCKIIMQARPELASLLSHCPYIDTLTIPGKPCPHYDLQTTTARLFQNFNTSIDTIPHEVPYLHADPRLVKQWEKKLAQDSNFKIGLCWQSQSYTFKFGEKMVTAPDFRPIDPHYLAQLAQIPHVSLYSLQKTNGEQNTIPLPFTLFDQEFDQKHGRFMDTAAVMKNLDLVITVDTATAHLAGALGIPTWVLLPHVADWRWFSDRDDSPWYPTMRLFRQAKQGEWEPVIQKVHTELQNMAEKIIEEKKTNSHGIL